ncbi:MAG TPA: amidase [Roseiarcus sp.]|jgi:aspartyl-tRNA(Asn)/glutamyl-tRNA(Gln) amidotransferase subunit A
MPNALWRLDATDLSSAFASGVCTPLQAVETGFERIRALDPRLNAMVALSPTAREEATASAERWRLGQPKGPLDGVPIVVKDNLLVSGMPAAFGGRLYSEVARRDELPIRRLREAGAIVLGKTNCPEFALEGYTANAAFGATRNPYDPSLTPGGSSGGSVAAVAAGYVPLAIGTDGGGSLRRPAAYTGLFGLKPGVGAVPRDEGLPQLLLDYEVVGAFARTTRDLRLAHEVLAGREPTNITSACPAPRRILYAPRLGAAPCDQAIIAACDAVAARFAELGHVVVESELPFDVAPLNAQWPIVGRVALAWLRGRERDFDRLASAKYVEWADAGETVKARDLYEFLDLVERLRREVRDAFQQCDAILTPSCAAMPWRAEEPFPTVIGGAPAGPRGHAVYTAWVNAVHAPAIAIPAGESGAIPIGCQLVGPRAAETMLLDLAGDYEARYLTAPRWPAIAMSVAGEA